jgi:ribosome biogenesis GTPase A
MPFVNKATTPLQRLKEQLQVVDVIFEVRDARLPATSMHPKTREFFGTKPRVVVFCKEDLADPVALRHWLRRFENPIERATALSLKIARGKSELLSLATGLCAEKIAARKRKGLLSRPLRVAVVGLPNVGKSSLINWMIGKKKAAVANTPGVTRGNSWIRIDPQIELLDTPGMLPLAAFKGAAALKLALCNVLPGEHYDVEEIADYGLCLLAGLYPESLETYRQGQGSAVDLEASQLEMVARARSCLKTGGVLDVRRAAGIFLSEFRSGKLGRVVLDSLAGPE